MKANIKRIFIGMLVIIIFYSSISIKADNVYCSSYILMEASSKRVLEGKNVNNRYLTASICKVLTAIIIIENCDIDEYVLVTKETTKQIGSSVYLEENDLISIRTLLYGLLLRSGNDCAYLLSTYMSTTTDNFALLMNKYAKMIGMKNSTFSNPSGLDNENENYSTAYDMALLTIYAMNNPTYRAINSTKSTIMKTANDKKIYLYNKHKLIQRYENVIGGKTGYTEKANRTLISYYQNNKMEFVCVTFNCGDDWNTHMSLFKKASSEYQLQTIVKKQIIIHNYKLSYTPYLENDIILPIKTTDNLKVIVYLYNDNDSGVGVVKVYNKNTIIYERELSRYYK